MAAIIADVTEERNGIAELTASASSGHEGPALNNRELDVLRFLVQGLTNNEIASRLGVSESVVKNTLQQLFAKTSVRTRRQLVRIALEQYRNQL